MRAWLLVVDRWWLVHAAAPFEPALIIKQHAVAGLGNLLRLRRALEHKVQLGVDLA